MIRDVMTALRSSTRCSLNRDHSVVLAWGLAAVVAGAFCSRLAVTHYGAAAIEAMVAVPLLVMIAGRPLVAVVLLVAVVSSVFSYGFLPRLNLPGHPPINLGDVCLGAAVGGTLWRRPWPTWPAAVRRYALALSVFLVLASCSTIKTSLLGSDQSRDALLEYRNLLYLGAALTVALELSGALWRTFLNSAVGLAALIAAISIAAAASHAVTQVLSLVSPGQETVIGQLDLHGATRVRLPGLYFVYAMCLPTLVMILVVKDRWRPLRATALLLMLGAIGVSLNRNMYAGLLVALVVTALLGGVRLRARIAFAGAVASASLVLVAFTSTDPGVVSAVGQRASTALSPSKLTHSSLQDRLYELQFALPAVARHPWFGVGPRQPYGAFIVNGDGQSVPRFFVQNLYIYIATDYGLPTAVAFAVIPLGCLLLGGARLRYATDPADRALLAGAMGTLIALLVSLLVGTYVQTPDSTVAFAVTCGALLAAALRTYPSSPRRESPGHGRPS